MFDLFFMQGNDGTMTREDVLLMAISVFRGIAVFMREFEFNIDIGVIGHDDNEQERAGDLSLFSTGAVDALLVKELFEGGEKEVVNKAEFVKWSKEKLINLEGVDVERPQQIFNMFSLM